jgi:phosphoglycolate phosphatase
MLPQLIVFDLDGTLVDSAATVSTILNEMRSELGKLALPKAVFEGWISLGAEVLISKSLEVYGAEIAVPLADFRDRYANLKTHPDNVYQGAFEALRHLQSIGVSLALCTNKPRALTDKVLCDTELDKFFPFICAGGDFPAAKPHPDNLLACLNYYQIASINAWFVGDSSVDQMTAKNVGVKFIFHKHGYDDGVEQNAVYASFNSFSFFNI